jgi:hypothetical protein
MRLHRNQLCPIHRSLSCCGREAIPKRRPRRQLGVQRIEDTQHPRGYRELRSNGEMRKLLDRKIVVQNSECGICEEKFTDYSDISPITSILAVWAAPGETTIRTTFRRSTGGARAGRDQRESESLILRMKRRLNESSIAHSETNSS